MIVTGEASGDLHGARVVRALLQHSPDLQICGMGGPELAAAGVEILFDATRVSVVGVFEVFAHLADICRAQRLLRQRLASHRPDLLLLIDLPDFNLLLASKAKKLGIPVFYYIAPQVWAWRSGRVKTIAARVDQLAVILPFEEEFFRRHGLSARYVGHPLLDSVRATLSEAQFRAAHNIPAGSDLVGLLPGSRRREVSALLPVFLETAHLLQSRSLNPLVFCIPRAATISREELAEAGLREGDPKLDGLDIRLVDDDRYALMAACRAVVAASGTVTLELAILGVPMVVVYKLSPLSYYLGRMLVRLDHFSLVNLIADQRAVPELLQEEVEPAALAQALSELLVAGEGRERVLAALATVRARLGEPGASQRVAEMVLALLARDAVAVAAEESDLPAGDEPVLLPIGPELDLHTFSAREVKSLIPDYLQECLAREIFEVRIIHGKGRGDLRRSVHALLARSPLVASYRLAEPQSGGWGATVVRLRVE